MKHKYRFEPDSDKIRKSDFAKISFHCAYLIGFRQKSSVFGKFDRRTSFSIAFNSHPIKLKALKLCRITDAVRPFSASLPDDCSLSRAMLSGARQSNLPKRIDFDDPVDSNL